MHLVHYLISRCYNFTHNAVFLSVLVFKSHDFSYEYQEQPTPTPNIGFSKVFTYFSSFMSAQSETIKYSIDIYNVVAGNERFYDDDDTERETIVHIGKCCRIPGTLNGLYLHSTYLQIIIY